MATIRTGGCSCGRLRYTVSGEPFLTGLCHCTNCRKESGSVFTVYAKWPIEAFEYQGEFSTFEGRSFCANCGSRLFNLHDTDVEIRIGSLDEAPTTITPMQEGWIKRREHWLQPIAGTSQASEDPER